MKHLYKCILLCLVFTFSSVQADSYTISYDPDYAPFSYNQDNKPYGLLIDIWKLWAKKNGHTLTFVQAKSWDDALELAKNRKVDFFLGTDPYDAWMQASKPFYKTKTALFTRKTFSGEPKQIGIIGEDYKEDITHRFPKATVASYDTYKALVDALMAKKVDAIYDDAIAIAYYAIQNHVSHFIKQTYTYSTVSDVCAISASPELVKIFDKGFHKLSIASLEKVEKNWIFDETLRFYNNTCFLSKTKLTYVYDPDWKPFEYQDKATHTHMGIIADLLALLSKKTGLVFTPLPTENWEDSIAKIKSKEAEMVSAIPYSEKNAAFLNFTTHPIYRYPAVLVAKKETPLLSDKEIGEHTIGVVKSSTLGKWVQQQYPHSTFVPLESTESGFDALKNREIDFFAVNGVTATYYINALGFDTFRIYKRFNHTFALKIALAKHLDPTLLSVIDQGLAKITKEEYHAVYRKWTSVKIRKEIDWQLLLLIGGFALSIIAVFFMINRKLKELVAKKTAELQQFNKNLEHTVAERTRSLQAANRKMQDNINYASFIQNALLPSEKEMQYCFEDFFILWQPKDTVGGDIYFFHKLSDKESLLFVVDCTGHGVSGAFVTMLVQAVKEQMLSKLAKKHYTPASMLGRMNRDFANLLNQKHIISDIGFDAAVIHIDCHNKVLTYAGAKIPLFYVDGEKITTVNADRHSLGYTNANLNHVFKETQVALKKDMQFYITTDGYLDQNGGTKGYPMGKRRFTQQLLKIHRLPFKKQKEALLHHLNVYKKDEEQSDDITLIGFEVKMDKTAKP